MHTYQIHSNIQKVKENGGRLERLSLMEARRCKAVVLEAVRINGSTLEYAGSLLNDDKEVVMEAVAQEGYALQFASDRLRDDKEVVMTAVTQSGDAFQYASDRLKDDLELLLAAINHVGTSWVFKHASERLKNDREAALAAVKVNGDVIDLLAPRFRTDDEVIREAVKTNAWALEYASERLRRDKEVIKTAVGQNKCMIRLASDELRSDDELASLAAQNRFAVDYVIRDKINDDEANRRECVRVAEEKGVRFLVHFTPVANLESILRQGLLTRRELDESRRLVENRDYFTTDRARLDHMRDTISLSFTRPNWKMFSYKMNPERPVSAWVVIKLRSSEILNNHHCVFFADNAACKRYDGSSLSRYDRYTKYDLISMFSGYEDDPGHTHDQAEVMCRESIPVSEIDSIVFYDDETAAQYKERLDGMGILTIVDKTCFAYGGYYYNG